MNRHSRTARLTLFAVTTALCSGLAAPAFGQAAEPVPARQSIDANGVDLFLGTMNAESFKLTMGSGDQAAVFYNFIHGSGWQNNVAAQIFVASSTRRLVTWLGKTYEFSGSGPYISIAGDGSTLVLSGGYYIFTSTDGTVVRFDPSLAAGGPSYNNGGMAIDITYANGYKLTYSYELKTYLIRYQTPDGPNFEQASAYRAASMTSSSGYLTQFTYLANSPGANGAAFGRFFTIVSAKQTNTKSTGSTSQTLAMSLDSSGNIFTVTDPMARVTSYRLASGTYLAGITRPGSSAEDVTVTYDSSNRVFSVTNPVGTTNYGYSDSGTTRTVTVTNPANKATTYTFDIASARMTSMTDATNRTTSWN